MIDIENYKTRADGVKLIRTYSDAGFCLVRNDGAIFDDAIDIEGSGYTYVESEELIVIDAPDDTTGDVPAEEESPAEDTTEDEISAEDALAELLEVLEQ